VLRTQFAWRVGAEPASSGCVDSLDFEASSGCVPFGHWLFSSAVPVLPATTTPGIAAAVPVPDRTTAIISRRTVRATELLKARVARAGAPGRKVGAGRRPSPAIVAAISAISSALA